MLQGTRGTSQTIIQRFWPNLLGQLPVADAFLAWARATPMAEPVAQPGPLVWWPAILVPPWLALLALATVAAQERRRPARA